MAQETNSEKQPQGMGNGGAEYANLVPEPEAAETSHLREEVNAHATSEGEMFLREQAQRGDSAEGLAEARAKIDAIGDAAVEKHDQKETFVNESIDLTTKRIADFQKDPATEGIGRVDLTDPTNPTMELINVSLLAEEDDQDTGRIFDGVYGKFGATAAREKAGSQKSVPSEGKPGWEIDKRFTPLGDGTTLTESRWKPMNGQPGAPRRTLEVSRHIQN